MAFVYFLAALVGLVLFAVVVNRLTGTKATYIEDFQLAPGERELWRDARADFARRPRLGQAVVMSYPRLRRHTVLWTNRRVVISQRVLLGKKHMLTHQIVFEPAASADASKAASQFAGGFYGRGFETITALGHSFTQVNDKACVRITPTETSASALNLAEAYLFSDRLTELERALESSVARARAV
jgi:hypothetical protein